MSEKLKYFIEAWEMNGVGQTVATVQDSPGTVVTITVDDLRALLARQPAAIGKQEAVAICTICNGYGRYQDGNSGTEADGYAPNIVECECADEERRPEYRVAAPLDKEASKPAASDALLQDLNFYIESCEQSFVRVPRRVLMSARDALTASPAAPSVAQPISDAMMDLVDRLGSEAKNVDPRAWDHLLVYAPSVEQQDERGVLPDPDTTYSAPWAGHTFKYHSPDQIIEYANARVRASTSANVAQGAEAVEPCKCQRLGDWKGFHHPLCDKAQPERALTVPSQAETRNE